MDLSLSDLGIFPLIFKGEIFFFSQQAIKLGWLPYLSSLDQGLSHAGDQYPVERYLLWDSHFQMMSPFTYSSHLFASPASRVVVQKTWSWCSRRSSSCGWYFSLHRFCIFHHSGKYQIDTKWFLGEIKVSSSCLDPIHWSIFTPRYWGRKVSYLFPRSLLWLLLNQAENSLSRRAIM